MDQTQSELELAWEELSFWRDFAVWWKAKNHNLDESRVQEALDNAEMRYEMVAQRFHWK